MSNLRRTRLVPAVVVALLIAGATPFIAFSSHKSTAGRHKISSNHVPVYAFGVKPGFNLQLSFETTIYGDGVIVMKRGGGKFQRVTTMQVPREALAGVLRLAEAETFFTLPANIIGEEPMPDSSPRFITVHTTSGTKTVTKHVGATNKDFDQLFGVLMAMVGQAVPAGSPPGGGNPPGGNPK